MSAIKIIQALGRKIAAKKAKTPEGITQIQPQIYAESEAGSIAATLQDAGIPLDRLDEFIKSEADLVRILNQIKALEKRNLAESIRSGIRNTETGKVFDMKGKRIKDTDNIMGGEELPPGDPDLPPPGSRGGPDDIAAPVQSADETIKNMIEAENKKNISKMKKRKIVEDAIDNMSPSLSGDTRTDAALVAEDMAESMGKVYDDLSQMEQLDLYDQAYTGLSKIRFKGFKKPKDDPEDFAKGGIARLGFKDGMTRRTFLKLLGGMAAVPIVGKFFKLAKVGKTVTKVPMIKTDDVAGKPEWFDALVNKVIIEGDDVTKKFATGERQSIHQKTLDDGSVVRVTEDVDDGAVRVEYQSEKNVFGDDVQLQYKKPLPDEGDPRPTAEFTTAESGPVGRSMGPDDFEIDVDEVGGTSIRDLDSDVSKLKEYATGKKLTMKEIVESKKRRDKALAISEDTDGAQLDAVTARQGDADDSYYGDPDEFASGGIARLLGE